jgi:hypothetical protein
MIRTIMVALAFAFTLPAISARAAARDRVFVASYGSDSNPCTFGSPCKTFQQAVDVVAAGGEVTAIDSAGFGSVTIFMSVTITSPNGVEAGSVPAINADSITIRAGANDVVSLRGLTLEGAKVEGSSGISVLSVGKLDVIDCMIRDYSEDGIRAQSSSPATIAISNSYFSNNDDGVNIQGPAAQSVTLDHVTMSGNFAGVFVVANQAYVVATITNSEFSNNQDGIDTANYGNNVNLVTLSNVTFNNNNTAIALGGSTSLALSHVIDAYSVSSSIGFNSTGITTYSEGNNHLSFSGPNAPQSLGAWPQQ